MNDDKLQLAMQLKSKIKDLKGQVDMWEIQRTFDARCSAECMYGLGSIPLPTSIWLDIRERLIEYLLGELNKAKQEYELL